MVEFACERRRRRREKDGGREDVQFFLVPEESLDGFAERIIRPASLATVIKKSWISWRFRLLILACMYCLRNAKSIGVDLLADYLGPFVWCRERLHIPISK